MPAKRQPGTIFSFLFSFLLVLLSELPRSITAAVTATSSSSSQNTTINRHQHLRHSDQHHQRQHHRRRTMSSQTNAWPEMVGMTGDQAEVALKADHPDWMIQVLPEGSMVTMDYREDRVRIFVDGNGKVVNPPRIG